MCLEIDTERSSSTGVMMAWSQAARQCVQLGLRTAIFAGIYLDNVCYVTGAVVRLNRMFCCSLSELPILPQLRGIFSCFYSNQIVSSSSVPEN